MRRPVYYYPPMKNDTKEKILLHGARMVYENGFNNTGIGEILKAAGVPKGSFYHYFSSKEDFGLELLDIFGMAAASIGFVLLAEPGVPPLDRLKKCFKAYKDNFRRTGYRGGCPIGNLCLEMGDLSPAFRAKLEEMLGQMRAAFATVLEEAKEAGEIPSSLDPQDAADFMVSSWEGALLQMKVAKDARPLEVFERMVFNHLLAG